MPRALRLSPKDNVAVCIDNVKKGDTIVVDASLSIVALDDIHIGHKVAIYPIGKGDAVIKYGETIGLAREPIEAGSHVHTHNLSSLRFQKGD
jgi:altronate hydrolase